MANRKIQMPATQLFFLFLVAIVFGGLLLFLIVYIAQNGLPSLGVLTRNSNSMAINSIQYQDVPHYLNKRISTQGFVIITNDTNNICGASGWATCKTWFSYDPFNVGLGPLTTKIPIGTGPDSITEKGDLYDHNGNHLNLVKTDQFGMYHVTITGIVDQCTGNECIINVDGVYSLP